MKILYGSENCVTCIMLKKEYEEQGVEFKYVDVRSLSPDEISNLANEAQSSTLPIIIER